MMVRSVNKNDFDRRFSKSFCRSQTTETATDDHYPRCLRLPRIRNIDRIEISIVHLSLSQAFEVRNLRESWLFSPARWSGQRRTDGSVLIQILLTEWRRIFNPFCHV